MPKQWLKNKSQLLKCILQSFWIFFERSKTKTRTISTNLLNWKLCVVGVYVCVCVSVWMANGRDGKQPKSKMKNKHKWNKFHFHLIETKRIIPFVYLSSFLLSSLNRRYSNSTSLLQNGFKWTIHGRLKLEAWIIRSSINGLIPIFHWKCNSMCYSNFHFAFFTFLLFNFYIKIEERIKQSSSKISDIKIAFYKWFKI